MLVPKLIGLGRSRCGRRRCHAQHQGVHETRKLVLLLSVSICGNQLHAQVPPPVIKLHHVLAGLPIHSVITKNLPVEAIGHYQAIALNLVSPQLTGRQPVTSYGPPSVFAE